MFKPMLAATCNNIADISFPVLASTKLDGIRAIVKDGVLVSRSLKPIPNKHVQNMFKGLQDGLDGELICGSPTAKDVFRTTTHAVMSHDGEPDVAFFVFDRHTTDRDMTYRARYNSILPDKRIHLVPQVLISSKEDLVAYEIETLDLGYEGIVVRNIHSAYKYGRSTLKERGMIKIKRFRDSEAVLVSITPLYHNANVATTNALGRTERSSHKGNKIERATMGSLTVKDTLTGVEFEIGTGFSQADRDWFWAHKHMTGLLIKYKYFDSGIKTKPRFPTFVGVRDDMDMDAGDEHQNK